MTAVLLIAGLVALLVGGDLLVRGALRAATALALSPFLVGSVLVGFGTSTPELVTSLAAAFSGSPGIALGNVVGSNICNILLILGLAALIRPIAAARGVMRRDGGVLALATAACLGVLVTGEVGRAVGAAFLVGLTVYLVSGYRADRARAGTSTGPAPGTHPRAALGGLGLALAGIVLVVLGARWLVTGAVALAQGLGVDDAVIGLTVVAVGTSLPELVTSVMAAMRRQDEIALGNVVGSNIFNILGILGATALLHPLQVPAGIAHVDGWVMVAATGLLLAFGVTGARIVRFEGALLLAAYAAYCGWLFSTAV